jgi:hypothetical protein
MSTEFEEVFWRKHTRTRMTQIRWRFTVFVSSTERLSLLWVSASLPKSKEHLNGKKHYAIALAPIVADTPLKALCKGFVAE